MPSLLRGRQASNQRPTRAHQVSLEPLGRTWYGWLLGGALEAYVRCMLAQKKAHRKRELRWGLLRHRVIAPQHVRPLPTPFHMHRPHTYTIYSTIKITLVR